MHVSGRASRQSASLQQTEESRASDRTRKKVEPHEAAQVGEDSPITARGYDGEVSYRIDTIYNQDNKSTVILVIFGRLLTLITAILLQTCELTRIIPK